MSADLSNIITRDIVCSFCCYFLTFFSVISFYNQRTKAINNDTGRYLEREGLICGPCPEDFRSIHVYTTMKRASDRLPDPI